ncbi:MAG: hypothetical protein U0736_16180 [Gemmataceae bacterium]
MPDRGGQKAVQPADDSWATATTALSPGFVPWPLGPPPAWLPAGTWPLGLATGLVGVRCWASWLVRLVDAGVAWRRGKPVFEPTRRGC